MLCSCINIMRVLKKKLGEIWYFPFAMAILHFNKIIQWLCITLMKAMWWLTNLYMFFASCAKDMAQICNLIIVRKFNEGIVIIVTSVDWCGLSKNIKFICNTFIWNLIVEFYRATKRNSNLVAISFVGSLQHCFWQS